jgi:hypothetical protein
MIKIKQLKKHKQVGDNKYPVHFTENKRSGILRTASEGKVEYAEVLFYDYAVRHFVGKLLFISKSGTI